MSDNDGSQTPPESLIDYPDLVDIALRAVVRMVLSDLKANGLPGQHYFFIAFRTDHPDVDIADDLRQQHPLEMSIVLQYQYENLVIEEDFFEVTLYFGGQAKHLHVPFEAVVGFVDPHVNFALQFQARGVVEADNDEAGTLSLVDKGQAELEPEKSDGSNVVSLESFRKK